MNIPASKTGALHMGSKTPNSSKDLDYISNIYGDHLPK
jgi:hypothetical protein